MESYLTASKKVYLSCKKAIRKRRLTSSPGTDPARPAILDLHVRSSRILLHGSPERSRGGRLCGSLELNVLVEGTRVRRVEMVLLAKVTMENPVVRRCPECRTVKASTLRTWEFVSEPRRLGTGICPFHFFHQISGDTPVSSDTSLGRIDYELVAYAEIADYEPIELKRTLIIQRALKPQPEQSSIHNFPQCGDVKVSITMPLTIHPTGEFPMQIHLMDNVQQQTATSQLQWLLYRLRWRLIEKTSIIYDTCSKHKQKFAAAQGTQHTTTRCLGSDSKTKWWDFSISPDDTSQRQLEMPISVNHSLIPVCDVYSHELEVSHSLIFEIKIKEELVQVPDRRGSKGTRTGKSGLLAIPFNLNLTQRARNGINWDAESRRVSRDENPFEGNPMEDDPFEGDPMEDDPFEEFSPLVSEAELDSAEEEDSDKDELLSYIEKRVSSPVSELETTGVSPDDVDNAEVADDREPLLEEEEENINSEAEISGDDELFSKKQADQMLETSGHRW